MQGRKHSEEEEPRGNAVRQRSHSLGSSSSTPRSTKSDPPMLPTIPPPFIMYASPGSIQGAFCTMPVQPMPVMTTSANSTVPMMSIPPQMFYTPTAAGITPYDSQHLPLLAGMGAASFLYPQLAAASQAAYLSALQGKKLASSSREASTGKESPPAERERRERNDREEVSKVPTHTAGSTATNQLLLNSERNTLLYSFTRNNEEHSPHGAALAERSPAAVVKSEDSTAMQISTPVAVKPEDNMATQMSPSIPSGSASLVSRLLAQKSKQPQASSNKPKTLEKLLTGTSKVPQDSLLAELSNEPHFVSFYRLFTSSEKAAHLRLRVLKTEGSDILQWIEVTKKASHFDPAIGPVDVARVLISSNGLCKLQLLFPYLTTLSTKFMPTTQEEADELFLELSVNHVLCPGLPDYQDKFAVLGYHPSHVRVLETSTLKRYDHNKCPLWHIPSNLFSKSGHLLHNMCKHCRNLQGNLVRQATKACEIDPQERESWTDPSSHRPLAFMSPADKEERYRKLRQERTQMLMKLKAYEDQLGITSTRRGSISGAQADSGNPSNEKTAVQQLLERQLASNMAALTPDKGSTSSSSNQEEDNVSESSSTTSNDPTLKDLIRGGRRRGRGRGHSAGPATPPTSSTGRSRSAKRKSPLGTDIADSPGSSNPPDDEDGPPRHKARRTSKYN